MVDFRRQVRDLDGWSARSNLAIPVIKPHQRILIGDVKAVAHQREPIRGVEILSEDGSCFIGAVAVAVPQQRARKSTRLNSSNYCASPMSSSSCKTNNHKT